MANQCKRIMAKLSISKGQIHNKNLEVIMLCPNSPSDGCSSQMPPLTPSFVFHLSQPSQWGDRRMEIGPTPHLIFLTLEKLQMLASQKGRIQYYRVDERVLEDQLVSPAFH